MKFQISRFSPHQNGKVFAVLMAISSLVFVVPFVFMASAMGPAGGPPMYMVLLMPVIYLVMVYLSVAVGCWLYNLLFGVVGGIEFETKDEGR